MKVTQPRSQTFLCTFQYSAKSIAMDTSSQNEIRITSHAAPASNDADLELFSEFDIPRLQPASVTFGVVIGQGASARVYKGTLQGSTVAIKQFKFLVSSPDAKEVKATIRNELKLLGRLCDSNFMLHTFGDLPYDTPRTFRDIVNQCLKCNPSDRPSLTLVQDSFKAYADNTPPPLILPRTIPETLSLVPINEGDKGRNTESAKGDDAEEECDDEEEEGDRGGRENVRVVLVFVSSRHKRVRQLRRRRLRTGATEVRPCPTEVAPGHGTLPRPVVIIRAQFLKQILTDLA
ncbi:hypothetical protein BC936DRAFT_141273 [Jimgerdemannia flammicorona]|uniref:Protein kinase domain-containing protein n=1 Tax=Jimgerdemannia flammicorona TaxID=994334 RepID=A0A433DG70_9FUNG|nr:hypothetical protein BC936DRAFT_141273 [Jimgerdemannia flammicorona]